MGVAISVQINTSEYEFSHGHKPRGKGTWAFDIQGNGGNLFWVNNANYGEAKKLAIAKAKERAVAACQATAWIRVGS